MSSLISAPYFSLQHTLSCQYAVFTSRWLGTDPNNSFFTNNWLTNWLTQISTSIWTDCWSVKWLFSFVSILNLVLRVQLGRMTHFYSLKILHSFNWGLIFDERKDVIPRPLPLTLSHTENRKLTTDHWTENWLTGKLLLALTCTVILGSESQETHYLLFDGSGSLQSSVNLLLC
jgi:hypothetical protein